MRRGITSFPLERNTQKGEIQKIYDFQFHFFQVFIKIYLKLHVNTVVLNTSEVNEHVVKVTQPVIEIREDQVQSNQFLHYIL